MFQTKSICKKYLINSKYQDKKGVAMSTNKQSQKKEEDIKTQKRNKKRY